MSDIKNIVQQLELFSGSIIELYPPSSEREIIDFEGKYALRLPLDYREFLLLHNGFSLMSVTVYGINKSIPLSLEKVFIIEHDEVGNPMPRYLIPFSPDGMGNHYCFDIRSNNAESCPIIFWQHDILYTNENPPEEVNSSFTEWVQEVVIDWTLEDYDYNGESRGT